MDYAILTNDAKYTIFRYGDMVIRYKSPYSLEYYSEIKEWDCGYIVVMTKYNHSEELIEEYIDLKAILEDLCIDEDFLQQIREVIVKNDGCKESC